MPCDNELSTVLIRRQEINDALDNGDQVKIHYKVVSIHTEFNEFTRRQIRHYEATFKRYNANNDGYLTLDELKTMMEKLGAPQTHIRLKEMIKEVDEDNDGRLSFREFLLVYRKAMAGEFEENSGLDQLAKLTNVDVDKVGVGGAKEFFEAKINQQNRACQFEEDVRMEQEERRSAEEERLLRRKQFMERAAVFKS